MEKMTNALILHSIIFLIQGYSLFYNIAYIDLQSNRTYGGRLKFLTFLDSCLQVLYFGFCVLHDVLENKQVGADGPPSQRSPLQKFKDFFLASVMFPIGTFVVLTFWGIYAVNRELVFPKFLDQVIPSWLNHNMHTSVLLFLLLDKWVVYHHYPSRKSGLCGTVTAAMIYQVWILWIRYQAGFWVYPVLEVLSLQGRIVFFAGLWVSMIGIYLLGEMLTRRFWGITRTPETTKNS